MILARNDGEAGAIDDFAHQWDLPPASSAHNNYWLWGPPDWNGTAAIMLGPHNDIESSRPELESVELAGVHTCRFAMPYESHLPIFICRNAKRDIRDLWPKMKHTI